jgi:ligand-binding SRPBCC domain-containing protein
MERCFDLARSIDFHVQSAASTREHVVGGVTSGLIEEGQEVEWRAKHLGFWLKMRVRITGLKRPEYFQDNLVEGPFHSFTHDHSFEVQGSNTLMTDRITFASPIPLAGRLADRLIVRHLRNFVVDRNAQLKTKLESNEWRHYLPAQSL